MIDLPDVPPHLHERVVCSIAAAAKYQIPANIVLAVAEKEAGKPGQWVRNTNGTHDVGPMQFNTSYLKELTKYGIRPGDVAQSGCYSYELAAWRLRGHLLKDQGDMWTKAANYHSRTPKYNAIYRADLMRRAGKWANWMEKHLPTQKVSASSQKPLSSPTANTNKAIANTEKAKSATTRKIVASASKNGSGGYVSRQLMQSEESNSQ